MWNFITSFIWSSAPVKPTEAEINEIQRSLEAKQAAEAQESDEENAPNTVSTLNFSSTTKRGTITDIDDGIYLIDHIYTYPVDHKAGLCIGATVLYDIMRENQRTLVTRLQTINDEDWCFDDRITNKERGWTNRVYLCQITKREGRVLTADPLNISIDLNVVSAEFMPIVGDWVYLDVKVEIDENVSDLSGNILEIDKVRVSRVKTAEGVITNWRSDTLTGSVSQEIFFDKSSLLLGYSPVRGDKVIVEAIESTQGTCVWRAIKLLLRSSVKSNDSIEFTLMKFNPGLHNYQTTLPNINVTDNLTVCSNQFNVISKFNITVANCGNCEVILKEVRNEANSPQVFVTCQNGFGVQNLKIAGGVKVVLEAKFKPCMIGNCREVLVFSFEQIGEIGRDVDCTLTGVESSRSMVGVPGRYQNHHSNFNMYNSYNLGSRNVIPGTKPKMPPRFIAGHVPSYQVPKQLIDYMQTMMEKQASTSAISQGLRGLYRNLTDNNLTMNNYEAIFHTLLHLEDLENAIAMRRYDRDCVSFIRNGQFLMLEVENLFEQRPSVIVGDRVMASDPQNRHCQNSARVEAYVHKVSANHLYLKFGSQFQDEYNGEDFAIEIFHSRGQFRKMHHAVYLACRNLGGEFLFPSKVVEKEPQMLLTWTPYDDELRNMKEQFDSVHRANNAIKSGQVGDSSNGVDVEQLNFSMKSEEQLNEEAITLKNILMGSKSNKEDVEKKLNTSFCSNSSNGNNTDESSGTTSSKVNIQPKKMSPRTVILARIRKEAAERNRKQQTDVCVSTDQSKIEETITKSDLVEDIESKLLLADVRRNNLKRPEVPTEARHFNLEWINTSLNYYQKEAVRNILLGQARPLPYFIFGPPGTGKTVTIIETILQLMRLIPHSRLLVATPSNSAADLIALRLIESGFIKPGDMVRFVANRIVDEDKIDPKLAPYCASGSYARDGTDVKAAPAVTSKGITLGVSSIVIGRHRITVGTCGALGSFYSMGFARGHFTHVIIDEAGQATEPESMIPLVLIDAKQGQAILAGDPMQLGPVCISKQAKTFGLTDSFLERILERFPYSRDIEGFPHTFGFDPRLVTRLIYNYRALPQMLELPNKMFYHSDLRATIRSVGSPEANLLLKIAEILPSKGLGKYGLPPSFVFHGINSENYQTEDSPSWFNPDEASQVFFYVNELYRLGIKAEDIGIISPYDKQVKQIRALLNEAEFAVPKVGSVEEFQGQEFPIILLSTVRSSEQYIQGDIKHTLGFLAHPRRLNVAITRGKSLTVIIGNPNLLSLDQHWCHVLKYCLENNAYIGCQFNRSIF